MLASAVASCRRLSCRSGRLPMAWAWAPALEPFRLCSLLSLSSGGAVGARSERVPTPLRGAGSPPAFWSAQGLEAPRVSPQSPANLPRPASPRLPRLSCWQVLASKNSSGGDSSLGLKEGDESGEGRQLHSQTRWGWGVLGGEYPMEEAPCLLCCLGGGQRRQRQRLEHPAPADTQDAPVCRAGCQCPGDRRRPGCRVRCRVRGISSLRAGPAALGMFVRRA